MSAADHAAKYSLPNASGNNKLAVVISPDTPVSAADERCHGRLRYPPNTECVFDYEASHGSFVFFQFTSFRLDLDCTADYVRVKTVGAPLGAEYDQTFSTCKVPTETIPQGDIIPWRRVRLIFRSDDAYSCRGFTAQFQGFLPFFSKDILNSNSMDIM